MVNNPKSILLDLQKELSSELLSDTFVVSGHKFFMTLLDEEETNWTFMFAKTNNNVAIGFSIRLPTLAMAIKSVDDIPVSVMFENDLKALYKPEQHELLEREYGENYLKFVYAGFLMDMLKNFPPSFIGELYNNFQELMGRRKKAQENVKNSSGEDSEKA